MKTLLICHLEPDFEATAGPLQDLVDSVVEYAEKFDRVINITSAGSLTGTDPFPELTQFREEEWIWGFDADYYTEEEPGKWIEGDNYIPTSGHEYSEILDWMKELDGSSDYVIVGGSRHECLLDVFEICEHLGLNITINEGLVY